MPLLARPDTHVLLVDADPGRLQRTREALDPTGAPVQTADSVAQALAAVRERPPTLAIVEEKVGELAGVALAGAMRQEPSGRDLPVIVLADAMPDEKVLARAAEVGAVDVLARPFAPGVLANKVSLLLGLHSESRRVQGQLSRAERLLRSNEQMVAGLIHDLRTPLMAINLSAEVALARSNEESVQQASRRIRASTTRMSRLFDHLLNLARVGGEVPDLSWKAGNLRDVASGVLEDARQANGEAIFEYLEEGDFTGAFDAEMITRTIRNLLDTSTQHAGVGVPVSVRLDGTHRDRLWVQVSMPTVIPADAQEALFVPGPSKAGREVPGFGLGLHHVDALVRAHGGSVVGRSRAPDGTVFELLLPRDALGA